jgi:hypothetical protein
LNEGIRPLSMAYSTALFSSAKCGRRLWKVVRDFWCLMACLLKKKYKSGFYTCKIFFIMSPGC